MENTKKEIKLSELTAYVQEGKKQADIMEIYGLNAAQVKKLMQQAKLTFRKLHKPVFTLIDDLVSTEQAEQVETENTAEINSVESEQVKENTENWSL